MAPKKKTSKGGAIRRTKRAATGTRYIVTATFKKMISTPISKTVAEKLARDVRKNGGTATIKKA